MIRVSGDAKFRVNYDLILPYTEEQWDVMSESQQNEIIDEQMDMSVMESAELYDLDVDDVQTLNEEDEAK